jgi:hypothetical protein
MEKSEVIGGLFILNLLKWGKKYLSLGKNSHIP